jgi:serine/threonine-protein kinase
MTAERYARICELFDDAVELPHQERAGFLRSACGDDTALRAEVSEMLAQDALARKEERFEPPFPLPDAAFLPQSQLDDANLGRRVGAYILKRLISTGGMGSVYLATRADDFQQEVAVKLIKGGSDRAELVLRFRHERQVLASLHHPNIAHLLDGGTTEDGTPFFVMEYIDGQPLDR